MQKENLDEQKANGIKPDVIKSVFGGWISIEERLPDNLSYQIVGWKLPSPDGESFVYGSRSAMCEIYKDKEWYGENGIKIVGNSITHWMPFPNPPKTV